MLVFVGQWVIDEQWLIDVAVITDEMVAALLAELGEDSLMDFVHGGLGRRTAHSVGSRLG